MAMRFLSKEQMVADLKGLMSQGWIENQKPKNSGGIGNTIDNLLGLSENNLPISDTAQWEMKTHRKGSSSLVTLFHMEPQPKGSVPDQLLPKYGWPDSKGRLNELSFRQTLRATVTTDRGFRIVENSSTARLELSFNSSNIGSQHDVWRKSVLTRVGLNQLDPQPYWEIQTLALKASTKMLNAFYVDVETQKISGKEHFKISGVTILQGFSFDKFLDGIRNGEVFVDFDARTHHNHGTKFRLGYDFLPELYSYVELL